MTDRKFQTPEETLVSLGRIGGWAYGGYTCNCRACGQTFAGAKRARHCLPCVMTALTEAPGWQPIETAPKDGTRMIVSTPHDGVVTSNFRHGCWQGLSTFYAKGVPPNEPTHWMPLPPEPSND